MGHICPEHYVKVTFIVYIFVYQEQPVWTSHSSNSGLLTLALSMRRDFTSNQSSLIPPAESIHDSIYAVSTLLVTQKQIKCIPSASNKVMITLWL